MELLKPVRQYLVDDIEGLLFVRSDDHGLVRVIREIDKCRYCIGLARTRRPVHNNYLVLRGERVRDVRETVKFGYFLQG
jgi:hypothetical protein